MINTDRLLFTKYITGFVLIVISCLLFVYQSYKNIDVISLPFFNGIYDEININIEIPQNLQSKIKIYNGLENIDLETKSVNNKSTDTINYSASFSQKSKYVAIILPEKYEKEFLASIVTANAAIGKEFFDFDNNEIRNFKREKYDNNGTKFIKIYFPENVTKTENSNYINYKGNFNLFVITFLSFFYCLNIYALPWIILI